MSNLGAILSSSVVMHPSIEAEVAGAVGEQVVADAKWRGFGL
jgi:hypothetical protein